MRFYNENKVNVMLLGSLQTEILKKLGTSGSTYCGVEFHTVDIQDRGSIKLWFIVLQGTTSIQPTFYRGVQMLIICPKNQEELQRVCQSLQGKPSNIKVAIFDLTSEGLNGNLNIYKIKQEAVKADIEKILGKIVFGAQLQSFEIENPSQSSESTPSKCLIS